MDINIKDINSCCLSGYISGHKILPAKPPNMSEGVIAWLEMNENSDPIHKCTVSLAFWGLRAKEIIKILEINKHPQISILAEFNMIRGEKYTYPQFKVYDLCEGKIQLNKNLDYGLLYKNRVFQNNNRFVDNLPIGEI
jgi:hypothetical protein